MSALPQPPALFPFSFREVDVKGFDDGEDGLVEHHVGAAERCPVVLRSVSAEEFVRVDGPEVPYAHLHLPFGIHPQGPYGLGFGVALGLVKDQGLDVLLFLAVVGGIYEASRAFYDVPDSIVEGIGGIEVLV